MNSQVLLRTEYAYGKSNIKDLYCSPPYRIMSPFMKGNHMEVCLMSSSAGLLGGDTVSLELEIGANCNVTFVSQSYEKILNTGEDFASRRLRATVGSGATLTYLPYPAIPFSGSSFRADHVICLQRDSELAYSDVFSCGRVGMGERYGMNCYKAHTKVYVENTLVYADNTMICPEQINYQSLGLWGEYTHNGMLYLYSKDHEKLSKMMDLSRELSREENLLSGATRCAEGILIRTLGFSGDSIFSFHKKIIHGDGVTGSR